MSSVKELIEKVKSAALAELEFCNDVDTPYLCRLIGTPTEKSKIVNLIVEYVGKNGMTISEAINYIERDLDPNLSN